MLAESRNRVGYSAVAAEYYDASKHSTCFSLRAASGIVLQPWIVDGCPTKILEVGAGRSIVAEIAQKSALDVAVTITDASAEMLEHSRSFASVQVCLAQADADSLPYETSSFDMLVASLGDPYNALSFWTEAHRVVRRGGLVLYTTPSFEWVSCYRLFAKKPIDSAEFEISDGSVLHLPSRVLPIAAQIDEMESVGFSGITLRHVALSDLSSPIATKLQVLRSSMSSVLTGFRLVNQ